MGAFGGLILTNKGRALQAKLQAGAPLVFNRIGIGDGNLGSQQISDLNTLIAEKKSLAIAKLKTQAGGKAIVGGVLSNQDVAVGFYFREIGVFAQDPNDGEILYCYANSGAGAEYIPPGGGADIVEKNLDILTLTGNAANVTAEVASGIYAAAEDVGDMSTVPTVAKDAAGAITELFQSVSDGKTKVAAAITGKGVPTAAADTFQTMADNIAVIETGVDTTDATALSTDMREGTTAYVNELKVTGNVPVRAGGHVTPGAAAITKLAGIYDADIVVDAVAGLAAGVIQDGAVVGGVPGTLTSDANMSAAGLLQGQVGYGKGGARIVGTIPNLGAANIQGSLSADVGIPAGYRNGAGKVLKPTPQPGDTVAQQVKVSSITTSTVWNKRKAVTISTPGVYRFGFDIRNNSNGTAGYFVNGAIYINGGMYSQSSTDSNVAQWYYYDISVAAGDSIEVWTRSQGGGMSVMNDYLTMGIALPSYATQSYP